MDQETVIQKTIDFVKEVLSDAEGGHDWWHIYRVWKSSKHIAQNEDVDNFVVELGALLHDIADSKFHGGHKGREIYNPDIKPNLNMTKEEYKNSNAPTLNHFYEKLLLLKDRMNTHTGKTMAEHRHKYMEQFLDEFYKEWNGEL